MNRAAPSHLARQTGFTLIEVLIALSLAMGAIVLGVALYRTVGQATQGGRNAEREWVTEQFLRAQAVAADHAAIKRRSLARKASFEFGFVTRRSAQWGEDGPPVLAVWRYRPLDGSLQYHEAALPPWWPEDRPPQAAYDDLANRSGPGTWDGPIFPDVASVQFAYWNERRQTWDSDDADPSALAPVVRMALRHAGAERVYAFATKGALSSFSSSGSSQAAQ